MLKGPKLNSEDAVLQARENCVWVSKLPLGGEQDQNAVTARPAPTCYEGERIYGA